MFEDRVVLLPSNVAFARTFAIDSIAAAAEVRHTLFLFDFSRVFRVLVISATDTNRVLAPGTDVGSKVGTDGG